jgi:PAS domain-containing protein
MESAQQKPLELILARNLLTSLSTPAFLADDDGSLIFYNEAAGALLGMSFEESGKLSPGEWGETFGPFDNDGKPIPVEELSTTKTLRAGRPTHAEYCIHSTGGDEHKVEVSAFPIVSQEGNRGAIVVFWPKDGLGDDGTGNG